MSDMERHEHETPAYYAVITADVRYDDSLSPSAKIFYGEVSALTDKRGFCWAGNDYFCRLYKVQARQIRRWLAELEAAGHVTVAMLQGGTQRQIRLTRGLPETPPGRTKKTAPPDKKDRHISTDNGTTFALSGDEPRKGDTKRPESEEAVIEYCVSIGLTAEDGTYYWAKWKGNGFKNGGHAILDWRQTIRSAKAGGYVPSQKRVTKRYETTQDEQRARTHRRGDQGGDGEGRSESQGSGIPHL